MKPEPFAWAYQNANTKSEYYEGFNEALVYVGNKIKEHFGVEQ